MTKVTRAVFALLLLAGANAAVAAEREPVKFTTPPAVTKVGDKITITFAVDQETDVAVYILDANGKIVRHLAAGVLGRKAPAPLKPGALSQALAWDGKDNDGKVAKGGPFKVRVALGLKPEFDKYLFHSPDAIPEVNDVAAGPGGDLYVFYRDWVGNPNMGGTKIKVFGRDGKHRRMVLPFPGGIAYEQVQNMGTMRDDDGRLVPEIHSWASMRFHPSVCGSGRGRAKKSTPAVDSKGTVHWMMTRGVLASLTADGGSPYKSFLSKPVFTADPLPTVAGMWCKTPATLAIGKDDRFLYVSGLYKAVLVAGKGGRGKKMLSSRASGPPLPCVYRIDLKTRGAAKPFAGDPGTPGKQGKLLTAPLGVACADGILYVADPGAGRVVGFDEKDGSVAGELKVAKPNCVGVDAGTGAVYVTVSGGELIKFESLKSGKELYRAKMPGSRKPQRIAVDACEKPIRIWLTVDAHRNNAVHCIDDTGKKLLVRKDLVIGRDPSGMGGKQLSFDRRHGDLIAAAGGYRRVNEDTGKIQKIEFTKITNRSPAQVNPAPNGNLVTLTGRAGLGRWTRDGKPLNWNGASSSIGKPTGITSTMMVLGMVENLDVFRNEIYVNPPGDWRLLRGRGDGVGFYTSLNVHGMDGKIKRTAIWQCSAMAIPRLDARGNVYLAENAKPRGRVSPKFFDGKRNTAFVKQYDTHNYMYGSIIKFPPEGGAVWFKKGVNTEKNSKSVFTKGTIPAELLKKPEIPISYPAAHFRKQADGTVQGAEWMRFGYAPYSAKWDSGKPMCNCENASFDVDPFGRVFYPNLGRFRIEMVDTNNNWLGAFGRYGNQDDRAKDGDVPMAWPSYVAVSDRYLYVSDLINLRIVRVKLGYEAEETVDVKWRGPL